MKIVKFFVVFNLILSISLINSVAAISVSDGSAFVTKAEFAADLNNLSNRMSTLENSLDAKIDSLVSSYLSRNGIWNGEKHTSSVSNFNYTNSKTAIITQVTKSGLLFLPYEIKIDYAVGLYSYNLGDKAGDSVMRAFGSPVFHAMNIDVVFYEESSAGVLNEMKQVFFYGLTGEYDTSSGAGYRLVLKIQPKNNQLMFVTKGSKISYKMETTVKLSMDWWGIKVTLADKVNRKSGLGGTNAYRNSSTNLTARYCTDSYFEIDFKTDKNLFVY